MAIQLNGDGLQLNYPTSTQTSGGKYPVGCAVVYKNALNEIKLNGTWAMVSVGEYTVYGWVGSQTISSSGSGTYNYALAIRVA